MNTTITNEEIINAGLPVLMGTEAQVKRANEKRAGYLEETTPELISSIVTGDYFKDYSDEWIKKLKELSYSNDIKELIRTICLRNRNAYKVIYFVDNPSAASIIENSLYSYDDEEWKGILARYDSFLKDNENKSEPTEFFVIKPDGEVKNPSYPVDIRVRKNDLLVSYKYDREYIDICKECDLTYDFDLKMNKYEWNQMEHNLTSLASTVIIKLASNGYASRVNSKEAYEKALDGEVLETNKKWIWYSIKRNVLVINSKRNDGVYDNAKKFKGIYYSRDYRCIQAEMCNYKDILAFAEMYNFQVSNLGMRKINEYIKKEEDAALEVAKATTLKIRNKKAETPKSKTETEKEAETLEALTDD